MDAHYIFLKSLQYGYDHINAIYNIFEQCVKHHYLNKKYKDDFIIRQLLYYLLNHKYVYRIKRGFYNITSEGLTYLETLKPSHHYDDTIKATHRHYTALY